MKNNLKFKAGGLLNTKMSYSKQISKSESKTFVRVCPQILTICEQTSSLMRWNKSRQQNLHADESLTSGTRQLTSTTLRLMFSFIVIPFTFLCIYSGIQVTSYDVYQPVFSQHMTDSLYEARLKWCQIFKAVHPSTHAWSMEATHRG